MDQIADRVIGSLAEPGASARLLDDEEIERLEALRDGGFTAGEDDEEDHPR